MAYTGIFATLVEVGYKAGYGANATATAETYVNSFIGQAESYINVATRYNWSDAYAALNADVKALLSEAASNIAASYCISYDMGGYTSRYEAQTMLDFMRDRTTAIIALLNEIKNSDFIKAA